MARAKATTEEKLVRSAALVFQAKGYHNTTIDDIAAAANVSKPTVYSYAKSKQWILERMLFLGMEEIDERIAQAYDPAHTPAEHLRALIHAWVECGVANRLMYSILFSEEVELSPAAQKRFREWGRRDTQNLQDLLDECVSSGVIPARLHTKVAAHLILSMCMSLYRWYDPKGPVDTDMLAEQIVMMVAAGEALTGGQADRLLLT